MKILKIITCLTIITGTSIQASDYGTIGAAVGAIGGAFATDEDSTPVERALLSGGAALAGSALGKQIEKKQRQREFEMYQMGRFHEAWVRSETDWYKSTLDRRTGRPPAFDGYWAMDIGMPNGQGIIQAMGGPQTASVPADRETYVRQFWVQLLNKNQMQAPEKQKPTHRFATMPK